MWYITEKKGCTNYFRNLCSRTIIVTRSYLRLLALRPHISMSLPIASKYAIIITLFEKFVNYIGVLYLAK